MRLLSLCAPEYPTWEELSYFLMHGSKEKALRKDEALNHLHWATTRRKAIPQLMALAIDHRSQLEELPGATPEKLGVFKRLAVQAALLVQSAPAAVADAFCASRLGGDWGQTFGTLPGAVDFDAILRRALPH